MMDHRKWPVAKEAMPFAIPLALLTALTVALRRRLGRFLWALPGSLFLFVLYFFRNPKREAQAEDKELLSPADGKVMSVTDIEFEDEFLKAPATKVTIFLSIFDVHINRSPITGEVAHLRYQEGKFLPAFMKRAPGDNERNYMGLISGRYRHKVLVTQIVGLLARRIVCWSEHGDHLAQGERFGLMKFGSCVELCAPAGSEIYVKAGDKVKGGVTIIGRLP